MQNPILFQINNQRNNNAQQIQSNQQFQIPPQIKNLMNSIQFASNPQLALQQLMNQNPIIQNIMKLNKNGTSLQSIAQTMAQQKGIDLNSVIQQLQS